MSRSKKCQKDPKISLFWYDFLQFMFRKYEFTVKTIEKQKTINKNFQFTINSEYAINILISIYVKIPTKLVSMF